MRKCSFWQGKHQEKFLTCRILAVPFLDQLQKFGLLKFVCISRTLFSSSSSIWTPKRTRFLLLPHHSSFLVSVQKIRKSKILGIDNPNWCKASVWDHFLIQNFNLMQGMLENRNECCFWMGFTVGEGNGKLEGLGLNRSKWEDYKFWGLSWLVSLLNFLSNGWYVGHQLFVVWGLN